MKILSYVDGMWFDVEGYGIIAGPDVIIAEDANHPGYFEVFDDEESCQKYCEETNAEEGTAYFRVLYNEWLWEKANNALTNPDEDEEEQEECFCQNEDNENSELVAAVEAMCSDAVDGNRFNASCIEAQMGMSIWEYCGCNTSWW